MECAYFCRDGTSYFRLDPVYRRRLTYPEVRHPVVGYREPWKTGGPLVHVPNLPGKDSQKISAYWANRPSPCIIYYGSVSSLKGAAFAH